MQHATWGSAAPSAEVECVPQQKLRLMADLLRYLNAGWLLDRAFRRFEIRVVLGVGFEWDMEHATDRGPRTEEPQWAVLNSNSHVRMGPEPQRGHPPE